jgi:hypothetical protein
MKINALACAALAAAAGAAQADVTFTLTNFTADRFTFVEYAGGATPLLTGTLTGIDVNATLVNSIGDAFAADLLVYVDPAPLTGFGALLQAGGRTNISAAERIIWSNGFSNAAGTTLIDSQSLATPITFTGTSADPIVYLGNGFNAFDFAQGTWTGTVTLRGVNVVPAPSAAALMGLGAVAGLRRRRR